jgi:hypothetical protein
MDVQEQARPGEEVGQEVRDQDPSEEEEAVKISIDFDPPGEETRKVHFTEGLNNNEATAAVFEAIDHLTHVVRACQRRGHQPEYEVVPWPEDVTTDPS